MDEYRTAFDQLNIPQEVFDQIITDDAARGEIHEFLVFCLTSVPSLSVIASTLLQYIAASVSHNDGGPGSGNHGHAGVPGQRGGSAPAGSSTSFATKGKDYIFEQTDEYGTARISDLDPSEQHEAWEVLNHDKLKEVIDKERKAAKAEGKPMPSIGPLLDREWYGAKTESVTHGTPAKMDVDAAKDVLAESMSDSTFQGWFRAADSQYKPRVVDSIISTPESRAAALNIMYENYREITGGDLSFEKFLTTPVPMYRGGRGQAHTKDDVFSSYSFSRDVAQKFAGSAGTVYEASIRPIDTWGSVVTNLESEIMVPSWIAPNGNVDHADGGPGSGNHGHEGRPGETGGSLPSGKTFNDRMREAYRYKENGEDWTAVVREMRKCIQELPAGSKFTLKGTEYTKDADGNYHYNLWGHERIAVENEVANAVDPFDPSKCPHFEDPKAADVAEAMVKAGDLDPAETSAKIPTTSDIGKVQIGGIVQTSDGEVWKKVGEDRFKDNETGEICTAADLKSQDEAAARQASVSHLEYPRSEGFTPKYGFRISQEKMTSLLQQMNRNQADQDGTMSVTVEDVERMVSSVSRYGNGDECYQMLAAQAPEIYEKFGGITPDQSKREIYAKEAENVEEFIARSDKVTHPVYRGICFNTALADEAEIQAVIGRLKPGEDISFSHIASWSSSRYTAEDYAASAINAEWAEGKNYSVVYSLDHPRSVASLSEINPEGECLSPKAARFRVASVKHWYDEDDDCEYYKVQVEEVTEG